MLRARVTPLDSMHMIARAHTQIAGIQRCIQQSSVADGVCATAP
jgi:hypothetical protein